MFSGRHPLVVDKKGRFFIDRDPNTFKYILEFLTYVVRITNKHFRYGEILSPVEASIHKKVVADFKYFEIKVPSLFEEEIEINTSKELASKMSRELAWLNVRSSQSISNGQWFNWNQLKYASTSHFQRNADTVTILKEGIYQILVNYTCQCSTSGNGSANIDLYVSGTPVARTYHGQNDGYYQSRSLQETLKLNSGDTVKVRYHSNSNLYGDELGNSLTIISSSFNLSQGRLEVRSSLSIQNGCYFNWNQPVSVPYTHFKLDGTTITILKEGSYQVFVQYACQCSTHGNTSGNTDLCVSGRVVSRVYHGSSNSNQQSRQIHEILQLKSGDKITVLYYSNMATIADSLANAVTMIPLF